MGARKLSHSFIPPTSLPSPARRHSNQPTQTIFISTVISLKKASMEGVFPMKIVLWILQILLAVMFFFHGWIFLNPPPELVDIMNAQLNPAFRIFLGVAEWLGAIGLLLPGITHIQPQLTAWAAAGLAIIVGSATVLHSTRGETSSAITTAILCVMACFVAYMRWKQYA